MGEEFFFQDAFANYDNLDLLIAGISKFNITVTGRPIIVNYSTPDCYLKAVNTAAKMGNLVYGTKTDDFFPYAIRESTYWSGYFTSRPALKRFISEGRRMLQALKQLAAVSWNDGKPNEEIIFNMESVMGIMQHHDAITGTEKQHVADDYSKLLHDAMTEASTEVSRLML